jgi:hypothetical protein
VVVFIHPFVEECEFINKDGLFFSNSRHST